MGARVLRSPAVAVDLEEHRAPDMVLWACPRTGGIWIDTEASRLIAQGKASHQALRIVHQCARQAAAKRAGPSYREPAVVPQQPRCPVCNAPLRKTRFRRNLNQLDTAFIELDICGHGTWFDAGELGRIVDWVIERERLDAAETEAVHAQYRDRFCERPSELGQLRAFGAAICRVLRSAGG